MSKYTNWYVDSIKPTIGIFTHTHSAPCKYMPTYTSLFVADVCICTYVMWSTEPNAFIRDRHLREWHEVGVYSNFQLAFIRRCLSTTKSTFSGFEKLIENDCLTFNGILPTICWHALLKPCTILIWLIWTKKMKQFQIHFLIWCKIWGPINCNGMKSNIPLHVYNNRLAFSRDLDWDGNVCMNWKCESCLANKTFILILILSNVLDDVQIFFCRSPSTYI